MGSFNPVANATTVCHYLAPVAIVTYLLVAKSVSFCLLQQPDRRNRTKFRRISALTVLGLLAATEIAQAAVYLAQARSESGELPQQDAVIHVLVSLLVYGTMALNLAEPRRKIWHPYVGAWVVALLFESALAALAGHSRHVGRSAPGVDLPLHTTRVVLLLSLVSIQICCALSLSNRQLRGQETEPLLNGSTDGLPKKPTVCDPDETGSDSSDEEDDDFDSDTEEPEADKKLQKAQRQRLQQSGSWISYVKDYKIFLPLLWPDRDRFIQACLLLCGLVMVVERFLNVLAPRQLGILTDALTADAGTGVMPWAPFWWWMAFTWLRSSGGLVQIRRFAGVPAQQYAYKAIGAHAFRHIMTLSMDFHSDKNSGELMTTIDQGQHLYQLIDFVVFQIIPTNIDLLVAFGYIYLLFDTYMVTILLFVTVAYIWLGVRITRWGVKPRRKFNEAWRAESKTFNEAVSNWQTVSHFNRKEYECERIDQALTKVNRAETRYIFNIYGGQALQSLIITVGLMAAVLLAVYRVSQGTAKIGQFITLVMYWRQLESPLAQMAQHVRTVSRMLTDSERLLQLLMTKPTVADRQGATELEFKSGQVEFDDVGFSYDPRKTTIKGLTFTARPGATIALVGETGGGKSTLMKLLYRYYDIQAGAIRIDGQDIRGVTLDSLRDIFGLVPQDPSLFNVTIMDNIRYARLEATDEQVMDACRAAAIHDKILTFPDGYMSKVGERGVKLSGGEMQRVSIARAILKQPKIVLLDEATSMIDAETESLIQQALRRLTAGRTTFVIAHRLSTIQDADMILVINEGQIVERGTHTQLFRQGGKYRALWAKQLSKEPGDQILDVSKDDQLVDVS